MPFTTCTKCGCDIEYHISDFLLNGNWKDSCQHIVDGKLCTCDEFEPTLSQLLTRIMKSPCSLDNKD